MGTKGKGHKGAAGKALGSQPFAYVLAHPLQLVAPRCASSYICRGPTSSDPKRIHAAVQEKNLNLLERALTLRTLRLRAKADAAHRRRQEVLKEAVWQKQLFIENSRLQTLRRLWRRRNNIRQSVAKPLFPANKLHGLKHFHLVVPPTREGCSPVDASSTSSANVLAYTEA